MRLEEDGAATILHYEVNAQVGGKLAQIGSRLIDSTAKKMAEQFFGKFSEAVTAAPAGEAAEEPAVAPAPAPAPTPASGGLSPTTWIVGVIAVVVILLLIFAI